MSRLVYFSSVSGNTHRFIEKLRESRPALDASRIPLKTKEDSLSVVDPYVLVLPTYGGGNGQGAVPKQVIKFLNVKANRDLLQGVIAGGNTNFYEAYCLAGDIISRKCGVPLMYRFELMGTPDDVAAVSTGLDEFWRLHP
jgi:protein involved in ribonucleotide reduction